MKISIVFDVDETEKGNCVEHVMKMKTKKRTREKKGSALISKRSMIGYKSYEMV